MSINRAVLVSGICAALFLATGVDASEGHHFTPVQLSLYAPVQIAPEDCDVNGVRIALIYGVNRHLHGADVGLWNVLTGNHYGVQIGGLVAKRGGEAYGVNIAGLVNITDGDDAGVSLAGIYNSAGGIHGVQLAGCHARAKKITGIQFSLFNYCEDLYGVQLGLLNYCPGGSIPFMLLINAKF